MFYEIKRAVLAGGAGGIHIHMCASKQKIRVSSTKSAKAQASAEHPET